MIKLIAFDLWETLAYRDGYETKLYSYTVPMLKQLREKNRKTGLISNSSVFAVEKIKKKTNLLDYIDYQLFPYNVGSMKPDLKIFEEMLRISRFGPEETLMVGNKFEEDVIPPRIIGMNAILFKSYDQLKEELRNFSIYLE